MIANGHQVGSHTYVGDLSCYFLFFISNLALLTYIQVGPCFFGHPRRRGYHEPNDPTRNGTREHNRQIPYLHATPLFRMWRQLLKRLGQPVVSCHLYQSRYLGLGQHRKHSSLERHILQCDQSVESCWLELDRAVSRCASDHGRLVGATHDHYDQ